MDRLRYVQMRAYSGVRHALRRRLTPAGRLALGALGAAAVFGLDTTQSMAFQAFSFLAALFLLAELGSLRFRARFEVRRALPRLATAGEKLSYSVFLRSLDAAPRRGLSLFEEVEDPRPTFDQYRAVRELPGETWLERVTGYGRWRELVALRRIVVEDETPVPDLPPGRVCEIAMELTPARRGVLRLRAVGVVRPDPLGLCKAVARQEAAQSVLVLPKRYPVPRLRLSGGRRDQPGGVSLASRLGDSQEFRSLRDYAPGDPLRRVHWRSWAKTGRPVVKDFEDEYFVRHALVLDTFARRGGEAEFEAAVSAAASFACALLTQESLLDLLFVGDKEYRFTAGRGLGGPESLLEVLACAEPCASRPFADLRRAVAGSRGALSGCVCVLLGFDDERRALVRELRALGVPVAAAVIADAGRLPDDVCAREGLTRLEPGRLAEGLAGMEAA
jgi:uncharacterized protein (DUF58 family)